MKDKKIITVGQIKYKKRDKTIIENAVNEYCNKLEGINIYPAEQEKMGVRKKYKKRLKEDRSNRIKAGLQHRKRINESVNKD